MSAEEFFILHDKINSLKYQNEINIQSVFTLELEDEKMWKELFKKEKILKKYEQENEELKKELAMKKKIHLVCKTQKW